MTNFASQTQDPITHKKTNRTLHARSVDIPIGFATGPAEAPANPFVSITEDYVVIPAQQIRIGTRKLTPRLPVIFKDDGIYLSVSEHTDANNNNRKIRLIVQGILKCRANLNFRENPIIMIQLESSCGSQIKDMLQLKDEEFHTTFKGPNEMKRYITIVPSTLNCGSFTPSEITKALKNVFNNMEKSCKPSRKILEEIKLDKTLDLFYAPLAVNNATVSNRHLSTLIAPAIPSVAPPSITGFEPLPYPPPAPALAVEQTPQNGHQPISVPVQKTVRLDCSGVRIGSMIAKYTSSVLIKMDNNPCIVFTIHYDGFKTPVPLHIMAEDILQAFTCFDGMSRIFLFLKWSGAHKIRSTLRMKMKDPTYDPRSKDTRRKHFIFTLHNVGKMEEESLTKITLPNHTEPFFQPLPANIALTTLCHVMKNGSGLHHRLDLLESAEELTNHALLQQVRLQIESEFFLDDYARPDSGDDGLMIRDEAVGMKCVYMQQVMQDPMRNKICGHSYERIAIEEFMQEGVVKCPYGSCRNTIPIRTQDLEENKRLKGDLAEKRLKNI